MSANHQSQLTVGTDASGEGCWAEDEDDDPDAEDVPVSPFEAFCEASG